MKRRRRWPWAAAVVGIVAVVVVAVTVGAVMKLNHEIRRVAVPDLTGATAKNTNNILMVGSTSRCALKVQNAAYGLCSQGVTGVNGDVIMILHLNSHTRSVSILSVPRDLFVPNARKEGANKIDAGLYEGPNQLVDSVQQDFGIPIQHYIELNFDSFINVVNALGGIKMLFPEPVYDAYSGLDIERPGCVSLDGTRALQVVRARHLQYKGPGVTTADHAYWPQEAQSDIARITRDHEFLRVLAATVKEHGIGNPLTDERIMAGVAPQLQVDSGLSLGAILSLVRTFHGVNPGTAPQLTLPVSVGLFGSYHYQGGNYGDVEFPDNANDQQAIDNFLGIGAHANSMTGQPLPAPASFTVSVDNGTGVTNQGSRTAAGLKRLGFKVISVGRTAPPGLESETVVYYRSTSPQELAAAQRVVRSMTGAVIMGLNPARVTGGADVTVVTGTNFAVTRPAAAAPGPRAPSRATSSSLSPPSPTAATNFAPPTLSNPALAPWDPRACTTIATTKS